MTWGRGSTRAWRTLRAQILRRDPVCTLRYDGCAGTSTEVDHVVNVASGGTDHPANLCGVCAPCHRRKSLAEAAASRRAAHHRPAEPHPGAVSDTPPPGPGGHRNV